MALNTSNSTEANYNEVNNFMRDAKNDQQVRVIKDEAGTRRVILDKDGLRTSPAGVDVFTATNAQLSFNSNNNTLKVVQTGTTTITAVLGGVGTATISHNLGYIPVIVASCHSPAFATNEYAQMPYIEAPYSSALYVLAKNGSQDIYSASFSVHLGSAAAGHPGVWTIKYYILQETAN